MSSWWELSKGDQWTDPYRKWRDLSMELSRVRSLRLHCSKQTELPSQHHRALEYAARLIQSVTVVTGPMETCPTTIALLVVRVQLFIPPQEKKGSAGIDTLLPLKAAKPLLWWRVSVWGKRTCHSFVSDKCWGYEYKSIMSTTIPSCTFSRK